MARHAEWRRVLSGPADYVLGIECEMIYGSVSTGSHCEQLVLEDELGWECAFVSEIDKYANQVIRYHAPDTPNLGDFSEIEANDRTTRIQLLAGGTPCQDFSVAGLRAGLAGERGGLTVEFLKLVDRLRPDWFLWENVPGVLSSWHPEEDSAEQERWIERNAFDQFLGGIRHIGYYAAWRVLDAQYFGVPQRRRRVFVVGHISDYRRAAAVLLEPESLSGHPAPSRESPEDFAGTLEARTSAGGFPGTDGAISNHVVPHCTMRPGNQPDSGVDISVTCSARDYKDPVLVSFSCKDYGADAGETSPTLRSMNNRESNVNGGGQVAVAFQDTADTVNAAYGTKWNGNAAAENGSLFAQQKMRVRRLMPIECERLQGWPDNWTQYGRTKKGDVVVISDTQRYKIIGNGWALPVVRWITQRIDRINAHNRLTI